MRFLVIFLVLVALPGVDLRAEEPSAPVPVREELRALRKQQVALVRDLLRPGSTASTVARGATWARELGLTELEPDLVEVLRRTGGALGGTIPQTTLAVFDALIQLDAKVEAEVLLPFVRRRRVLGVSAERASPAVILAIRSGNPHTQLAVFDALDANDGSPEEAWLALGNTLVDRRGPAGFVARLLSRLEVTLKVAVVDHDVRRGWGGSVFMTSGYGGSKLLGGYPTVWRYQLVEHRRAGDVLLADGPRPIYARRCEVTDWRGSSRGMQDRSRDRLAWIAARMPSKPEELPLQRSTYARIRWADGEAFLRDLAAERAKVERAFEALVAQQTARGAISEAEARTLHPRIDLDVRDDRIDKSVPLPPVPDAD